MTAMFPGSGVPPSDAVNSLSNPDTKNCDELWYSTSRCQPRFDPAAANAVLAELINLINKGEVSYDCTRNDQIQTAIRYLIQRGLPIGAQALTGPLNYLVTLDPPLTRYNDNLVLVLVPEVTNTGPVKVNVNGQGFAPVFRNDGLEMQAGDWVINRPQVVSYWRGAFYEVAMVHSQVPSVFRPGLIADGTGYGVQTFPPSVPGGTAIAYYHVTKNNAVTSTYDGINLKIGAGEEGVWSVYGALHGAQLPADCNFSSMSIFVNGTEVATESQGTMVAGSGNGMSVTAHILVNVGDVIQSRFYHQTGGGNAITSVANNRTRFSAFLISK